MKQEPGKETNSSQVSSAQVVWVVCDKSSLDPPAFKIAGGDLGLVFKVGTGEEKRLGESKSPVRSERSTWAGIGQ